MGGLSSLGGAIVPSLAGMALGPVGAGLVKGVVDYSNKKSNADASIASKKLDMQQKQAAANLKLDQLNKSAQNAEEERLKNLKVALAKQRASFGASGMSSADVGSSKSVLDGLLNDSEDSKSKNDEVVAIKKKAIEDSYNTGLSKNLLELSNLEDQKKLSNNIDLFY
ncbi:MAG: hypothetical protein N4A43_00615 [Alphaproteobacteria bacterium]|jgi:hypothetical protein|nr:hypothetical protein [Alphaproteobacteria bacterium]